MTTWKIRKVSDMENYNAAKYPYNLIKSILKETDKNMTVSPDAIMLEVKNLSDVEQTYIRARFKDEKILSEIAIMLNIPEPKLNRIRRNILVKLKTTRYYLTDTTTDKNNVLNKSIKSLMFNTRLQMKIMYTFNITTIGELISIPKEKILSIKGMGPKLLNELILELDTYNLKFKG